MAQVAAGRRVRTRIEGDGSDAETLTRLEREVRTLRERQDMLFAVLGFGPRAEEGDRGTVGELNEAVLKIQDYLLRTSERLDSILGTLKNHRDLLEKMGRRVYQAGTRERIRMELDIMKTTASILALNGVELDETVLQEIDKIRQTAEKEETDIVSLRQSKDKLDKHFYSEVKKFDLTAIYKTRNKLLAGYG